jgi:NAD(P)-dependent dehydrogenase (short-subunit alcohol dehydrogenase family)
MNRDKRFALVTGASRGIGRALVFALARDGYTVAACSRSAEKLGELEAAFRAEFPGGQLHTASCDVANRDDLRALAGSVRSWTERLDVLINNAGVFYMGSILDEEEGSLERMMDTNLYSAYHLTRALAPMMVERGSGDIVNIASVASLKAYPGGGSYGISKHALLGFSRNLREELKERGIRVLTVLPGAVLTDSWSGVNLPPERFIAPEDLAELVASALRLSGRSVVEELVIRPQLGDL